MTKEPKTIEQMILDIDNIYLNPARRGLLIPALKDWMRERIDSLITKDYDPDNQVYISEVKKALGI